MNTQSNYTKNTFLKPFWPLKSAMLQQSFSPDFIQTINYKNIFLLRKYISIEGKILPRRLTNLSAKKQRLIAKSVKTARIIGFLPFVYRVFY